MESRVNKVARPLWLKVGRPDKPALKGIQGRRLRARHSSLRVRPPISWRTDKHLRAAAIRPQAEPACMTSAARQKATAVPSIVAEAADRWSGKIPQTIFRSTD